MVDDTRRGKLREKGQITLPSDIRAALHVDVGDDIEFEIQTNGAVVMRGLKMIPADQAWFWTDSWQKGEREASDDIMVGNVETFKDGESFLEFIEKSGS